MNMKKRKPLKPLRFKDPLGGFDWDNLCADYDRKCGKFRKGDDMLSHFDDGPQGRPATDRECYERLLQDFRRGEKGGRGLSLGLHAAMYYWKHYSGGLRGLVRGQLRSLDPGKAQKMLNRLRRALRPISRASLKVLIGDGEEEGRWQVTGMATATSLPTRSTFLHFLRPDTAPVFDSMALKALGDCRREANKSVAVYGSYVDFVSGLARKNSSINNCNKSSSVPRMDGVVPFAVKCVALQTDFAHLFV